MNAVRTLVVRGLVVLALCAWSLYAFGRAGGGESYSGGSSYSSGGDYSSGSDYGGGYGSAGQSDPQVLFLILMVVLIWMFIWIMVQQAGGTERRAADQAEERRHIDGGIHALREIDPDFSAVAFRDFAHGLYHEAHRRRGLRNLINLNPYLTENARSSLEGLASNLVGVDQIVVGSCSIAAVGSTASNRTKIVVEFVGNYREDQGLSNERYYTNEIWTFVRDRDVRSKPPRILLALGCPKCGAPRGDSPSSACPACGVSTTDHRFGWVVNRIALSRETITPRLSNYSPEESRPDRLPDNNLERDLARYVADHPAFALDAFLSRAGDIFLAVQNAWSDRRIKTLRPLLSDTLFENYRYWLEEHARQNVRNRLSEIKIHKLLPLSISCDRFYASLTVRVDASMIDTLVDAQDRVIDGDSQSPRGFTEYWTFIKGTASRLERTSAIDRCPACGAAVNVGMSGACTYCNTHITTGDFDWILSSIEQE